MFVARSIRIHARWHRKYSGTLLFACPLHVPQRIHDQIVRCGRVPFHFRPKSWMQQNMPFQMPALPAWYMWRFWWLKVAGVDRAGFSHAQIVGESLPRNSRVALRLVGLSLRPWHVCRGLLFALLSSCLSWCENRIGHGQRGGHLANCLSMPQSGKLSASHEQHGFGRGLPLPAGDQRSPRPRRRATLVASRSNRMY